ncbi:MAG: ribonuclease [Solirubrobacterales bacterium]|jgi:ribonuclease-3|nr:ribonuclease [Solirubrobacterales bacterium]
MARGIRRLGLGGRGRRVAEPPAGPAPLRELLNGLPLTLRRQALTHSSWVDHRADSYGRLAFLGDSVLGLAIAEHLFITFPRADIGRLTKMHGQAVSGRACAEVALELGVPELLDVAAPDRLEGGIEVESLLASERALASVCEAVIGACYLHHGFDVTAEATVAAFAEELELASERLLDFKSALQERLAREGARVRYDVTGESGPPHDRVFEVSASVNGEVVGSGTGRSKKAAEQAAAEQAMQGSG